MGTHFQGLNLFDQRFANGGNQFSVEPPDQALCAGNGFIFEAVNDVARVYTTSGAPAGGRRRPEHVLRLSGGDRPLGAERGPARPLAHRPGLHVRRATHRFYLVVLTLDHVGLCGLNGNNHLDIAVSNTAIRRSWTIFKLPVQNNGTEGTPDHHCGTGFASATIRTSGPMRTRSILTTNEFAFTGPGFYGAQIYAIGKNAAHGAGPAPSCSSTRSVQDLTAQASPSGRPPCPARRTQPSTAGSEYFLSSRAVFSDDGTSYGILQWTVANSVVAEHSQPAPTASVDADPCP